MSEPVITARRLTKRYGTSVVVDSIDFDILRGETFGLLGPNGAGKTTTILMMLGLTDVSDGEVRVMGRDPVREPLAVKRRVGYLPDAVGFYDGMTAFENLSYTARLMGFSRDVRRQRIADALARVRLADVADKRVATFSRGMRQRLGPCRARHEGRRDRDPRRADLRPRSAIDPRVPRHDRRAEA